VAIAAERSGRETRATAFILDGDVHLNEPSGRARRIRRGALGKVRAGPVTWSEIRLRTYQVAAIDGEIEVAL
jgi:hypothetical protein